MIYLFDKLEKLVKIVDETVLIDWRHILQVNQFERATFELPADFDLSGIDYFGFFDDEQVFKMFRITNRETDDVLFVEGMDKAESDLRTIGIIQDKRPTNVTAEQALYTALEGTGYQVGKVTGLPTVLSTSFYFISPAEALVKIIEKWNCEFRIRYTFQQNKIIGRYVDLAKRFGKVSGKQFVYGDNALSVVYEESKDEVVTALIGRGKGEQVGEAGEVMANGSVRENDAFGRRIDFSDVVWSKSKGNPVDKPKGQNYLVMESARPNYGLSQDGVLKHRWGVWIDEEVEDPNILIERTWEQLQKMAVPLTVFKANLVDMDGQAGYGDSVAVIRDEIGVAFEARIHKLVVDKLNASRSTVELGDYETLKLNRSASSPVNKALQEQSLYQQQLTDFYQQLEEKMALRNAEIDEAIRLAHDEWDTALEQAKADAEDFQNELKEQIDSVSREADAMAERAKLLEEKATQALEQAGVSSTLAQSAKEAADQARTDAEAVQQKAFEGLAGLAEDIAIAKASGQVQERETASLKREVEGIESRFENLRIGTRNLFQNTQSMPLGNARAGEYNFITDGNTTVLERLAFDGESPATTAPAEGLTHYLRLSNSTSGSVGLAQQLNLANVDSPFVESFYLRTDGNLPILLQSRVWDSVLRKFIPADILEIAPSAKWTRVQVGFILESEGWNGFRIQFLSGKGYATDVSICGLQLERGTIVSDYHPNDDDVSHRLTAYVQNSEENMARLSHIVESDAGRLRQTENLARQTAQSLESRLTKLDLEKELDKKGYLSQSVFDNYRTETAEGIERGLTAFKKDISEDMVSSVDFNKVRETAQLYEQIIGKNEGEIQTNIARQVMTSDAFVSEIVDVQEDIRTTVNQLTDTWGVSIKDGAGQILSALNFNKDEAKIKGGLIHLDGKTLIDNGVIKSAMIDSLDAGKITTGTLDANRIAAETITASHLKVDQAFFNKLGANEAYLKQLFAKSAFISQVQAVTLSANKISGGLLVSSNGNTQFNLNNGRLEFNNNNTGVFRVQENASTQGILFRNDNITVNGTNRILSRAIFGAERRTNNLTGDWNKGGFNGIVVDTVRGINTTDRNDADRVNVIGDNIRLVHSYHDDADTLPVAGWNVKAYPNMNPYPYYVAIEPIIADKRKSRLNVGEIMLYTSETSGLFLSVILDRILANIRVIADKQGIGREGLYWNFTDLLKNKKVW